MTVPAMGGTRAVPEPDAVARDYLLLALRLDQHLPGLVTGYFGPAALKAQVDMEQLRPPARLRDDARALRARVSAELQEPDRRAWLEAQLLALEMQAATLVGEPMSFPEQVARCAGFEPARPDDAEFASARAAIEAQLPGSGPLGDRLAAWDRTLEVDGARLPDVVAWLVERFRVWAAGEVGLPDDEGVRVRLVSDRPWAGYAWPEGGRRSRVELRTDPPLTAPDLLRLVAHQTYPGLHLEHAWREATLVDGLGRLEATVVLADTPERALSEGLATTGVALALPPGTAAEVTGELFQRAGLAIAAEAAVARAEAERCAAIAAARATLSGAQAEAAYRRHADGDAPEDVIAYLVEVGGDPPAVAARCLESIEDPRRRRSVVANVAGARLVDRWVHAAGPAERVARFGALLREQRTPGALRGASPPV